METTIEPFVLPRFGFKLRGENLPEFVNVGTKPSQQNWKTDFTYSYLTKAKLACRSLEQPAEVVNYLGRVLFRNDAMKALINPGRNQR